MKELKFIHISKTGGTSIEDIGNKHNKKWGRFHIEYGRPHKKFNIQPLALRKKYDWFTIVRNPYTRIISECSKFMERHNIKTKKIHKFNKLISRFINRMLTIKKELKYINVNGAHYTPQSEYIDDISTIHIIKYENLKTEFENLMVKYKLNNIKLDKHHNKSIKLYTVKDLYPTTIELIKKAYLNDFILFDYSIDPNDA